MVIIISTLVIVLLLQWTLTGFIYLIVPSKLWEIANLESKEDLLWTPFYGYFIMYKLFIYDYGR